VSGDIYIIIYKPTHIQTVSLGIFYNYIYIYHSIDDRRPTAITANTYMKVKGVEVEGG